MGGIIFKRIALTIKGNKQLKSYIWRVKLKEPTEPDFLLKQSTV